MLRLAELRGRREPLFLSVIARAAVEVFAADQDEPFRRRTQQILGCTEALDIDPESIRCAGDIARELVSEGRRIDGVDLFVAASARQHGQAVLSRNPCFDGIRGLECQRY